MTQPFSVWSICWCLLLFLISSLSFITSSLFLPYFVLFNPTSSASFVVFDPCLPPLIPNLPTVQPCFYSFPLTLFWPVTKPCVFFGCIACFCPYFTTFKAWTLLCFGGIVLFDQILFPDKQQSLSCLHHLLYFTLFASFSALLKHALDFCHIFPFLILFSPLPLTPPMTQPCLLQHFICFFVCFAPILSPIGHDTVLTCTFSPFTFCLPLSVHV